MKVLIFGANSTLAVDLAGIHLAAGHAVTGIYHTGKEAIPAGVHRLTFQALAGINTTFDLVYIVGAFVPRGQYNVPDSRFNTVNIQPVAHLCSRYPNARFVFCSSVAVYGSTAGTITEATPVSPADLYAASKLEGEKLVQALGSWAIVRFSSLYGKGIGPNNFINRTVGQAQQTGRIQLFGNGKRCQNYVYITDAARYLYKAAIHEGNGIFLGTYPGEFSNNDIAGMVAYMLEAAIAYAGEDNSPSFAYDNIQTRTMLNFSPQTDPLTGIKAILHD